MSWAPRRAGMKWSFPSKNSPVPASPLLGADVGGAVEHTAHAVELPAPSTLAIGAPLPKVLRLVAHHLEEQPTVLVGVVVGRDDPAASTGRRAAVRREEVGLRDADGGDDP